MYSLFEASICPHRTQRQASQESENSDEHMLRRRPPRYSPSLVHVPKVRSNARYARSYGFSIKINNDLLIASHNSNQHLTINNDDGL